MSAFGFFDQVYIVSLPDAAKRREQMTEELDRFGICNIVFIGAKPPPPGFSISNMRRNPRTEFGCNLSHMLAISHAIKQEDLQYVLFLEDDVRFDRNPAEALRELPHSWKLVFLGGHPRSPVTRYSASLVKVNAFCFAEAYGLTWEAMREFQDFWFRRIGEPQAMFDICLSDYAKGCGEAYACYPPATHQVTGISQISGKAEDKRDLVERGWKTNLVA